MKLVAKKTIHIDGKIIEVGKQFEVSDKTEAERLIAKNAAEIATESDKKPKEK